MQKSAKHIAFIFLSVLFIIFVSSIPYKLIILLDNYEILSRNEFVNLCGNKFAIFDNKNVQVSKISNDEEKLNEYMVKFKLFNLFNIKNIRVKVVDNSKFYIGGDSVGLNLKSKGVVIVGGNYIVTKNGNYYPLKESGLKVGDIITKIDNRVIENINTINDILLKYDGKEKLNLEIKRKNKVLNIKIKPQLEIQTNQYKLGVWIRDDAMGVGTLTYINPDNLRYGSLGHAIIDADTKENFEVCDGEIYKSKVIGVKSGIKGFPGEIMGLFIPGRNKQGTVDKNCNNGVFGYLNKDNDFILNKKLIEVGGKLTAQPGKAQILTTIDGENIEAFNIDIIKTNYQTGNNKSMVIKITDKNLIKKTGGIVQGMSGSPIVQNGKIIGAVTHVFVNDPTRGFGIYLDWMIDE